jgi:site-specific recombinase XerD
MNASKKYLEIIENPEPEIDPTVFLATLESFKAEMLSSGMKPRTVDQYIGIVMRIAREAGRPIVTAAEWDRRNRARVEGGIAQSTRRHDQIAFEKYVRHLQDPQYGWSLRFAEAYGAEPISPIHKANRIQHIEEDEIDEHEVHAISRPEFRALVSAIHLEAKTAPSSRRRRNALRDAAIFCVAGAYGLRVMEVAPLRVGSWSPYLGLPFGDFSMVRVIGKSKKFGTPRPRWVYTVGHYAWITKVVQHHIAHVMPLYTRGDENDHFLFRIENGNAINEAYLTQRFKIYRKAAGLSAKCTPHGLRRMHATQLALSGVDIYFIQSQLGHSSVSTTMKYIKLPPDFIARMVRESQGRMLSV